jgi:RNA polymerase primary sigma factor
MSNLSKYYEEICRTPLITKEEEQDLFLELNDDGISEAKKQCIREKIIKANLRFVFKQAKYRSKNDPDIFEELIAAGNEGLIVGLNKYTLDKGVRFLTYAGWWIDQRIYNQMSKMRIVSLPMWKQQLAARIQKFVDRLEREPNMAELKEAFPDVSEKDLLELTKTKYLTFYLEDMNTDDPSFQIDPIGTEVEAKLDKEKLHKIVNSLPSPHKDIIVLCYGLSNTSDGEMSNNDIATKLNIPKEHVRQFRKEALSMLKGKLSPKF